MRNAGWKKNAARIANRKMMTNGLMNSGGKTLIGAQGLRGAVILDIFRNRTS
jgi:hypothetical protein